MRIVCGILMSLALVGCASAPSSKTVALPSAVTSQIAAELAKIGRVVAPPPTEKLYAPLQEREPYAGVQVRRDVRYGGDARHLLDVFTLDKPQANQPVLVFVHGGAFMRGERRTGDSPFYDNIMLWAVRQGMVGVNMTYRLAPAHPWPAAQQDIQSALKWVRENIAASGGNPQRIILMGHSAGAAHVAQYLAHPQFHVVPGSGLAGAVMLSGIFDPTTAESNPPLQAYFGQDAAQYPARSAVPGLVASQVLMLLAYAELDPQDFHTQSEQLNAALCKAGKCPGLYKLMGHSHMSEIYSINSADKTVTTLMKQLVDRVR
ncbi:alpha/beta hydrolase [Limnohabitans parvus]|nr:alpha/beta hydrolase [Limnohabitans parvus]